MRFSAIVLTLLTAVTYVAASPEFVTEDHPAAREIIETYGSENLVRDDEGVLYKRFYAGKCLRTGSCVTPHMICDRPKCKNGPGTPCTCG